MRSDISLARAAAAGDRDAFDRLYRQLRPGLVGFVFRQVGDHHTAEDIVQETFLIAWRDMDKLRDPAAVKTWLFSIAYRRAMSAAARVAPTPLPDAFNLVDDEPARQPEQVAEQREAYELVWAAAHGLEPRQRAVLELAVRWELSSRQIGEVLGVGTAHAAVLVHRSRAALGNAVRSVLIARQQGRCRGLDAIVHGHRRLTARQRSSVEHHIRRCEDCKQLSTRVGAHVMLGVLLSLVDGVRPEVAYSSAQVGYPAAAAARAVARSLSWPVKVSLGLAAATIVAGGIVVLTPSGDAGRPAAAAAFTTPPPTPTASLSASASASARPSATRPAPPATLEEQMLALVNQARKTAGCPAVHTDSRLAKAAKAHSEDMAKRDYFAHSTPEGVTPWDRAKQAGYDQPSAENIAAGNATAKATMQQWMNSPGHRANILNCASKAMGVGRATGGSYRFYWTQMFGYR